MKYCLAICYGFLISICLSTGIVCADDLGDVQDLAQITSELQDAQSINLLDEPKFDEVCLDEIAPDNGSLADLDGITIEDIEGAEVGVSASDLTLKDKAILAWAYLRIKASECKDKTKEHILRNTREYAFGAATALVVLAAASIYYFGFKKNDIPIAGN